MTRWLAIASVFVVIGCERASEPQLDSASIGWHVPTVGSTWSLTSTHIDTGPAGFEARRTRHSQYTVVTLDGERTSKARIHTDQDDHAVNGKPAASYTGTFVISGTPDSPQLIKEDGELAADESDYMIRHYKGDLSSPAAEARILGARVPAWRTVRDAGGRGSTFRIRGRRRRRGDGSIDLDS